MKLPTRRTLNDYTHWVSAKPGFSSEVDEFLRTEAKVDELEDWQRFVPRHACTYMYGNLDIIHSQLFFC